MINLTVTLKPFGVLVAGNVVISLRRLFMFLADRIPNGFNFGNA